MNKNDIQNIRDQILLAALPNVSFEGWSWDIVQNAAEEAGHERAMAKAVFPGRMKDVLDAFANMADREMLALLSDVNASDLRVRDRIREAVIARLKWLSPHKEAVRQSTQFWLLPTNKPRGAKIVWRSADRIWDWAGDTSTDYNRYTKRGLLSGILVPTMMVWLNDPGEDMDQTKAFLDRRIENVMQLGKIIGRFKKVA